MTRDYVIALFDKCRALPGAPFDESHFLDFLIEKPADKGAVRNSFAGLRRFNRFIDSIEMELGICFSQADLERPFSLDAFVERANALRASPKGCMASLKSRERAGAGWMPVSLLGLLLIAIAIGFKDSPAISITSLFIAIFVAAAFAVFAYRNSRHLAHLRRRVESQGTMARSDTPIERASEE